MDLGQFLIWVDATSVVPEEHVDAMRDHFIELINRNLPDMDPPASRANINALLKTLIVMAIGAKRTGISDPIPWFTEACVFALQNDLEQMGLAHEGKKPVVN